MLEEEPHRMMRGTNNMLFFCKAVGGAGTGKVPAIYKIANFLGGDLSCFQMPISFGSPAHDVARIQSDNDG